MFILKASYIVSLLVFASCCIQDFYEFEYDDCYYFSALASNNVSRMSWNEARDYCKLLYSKADLATVDSCTTHANIIHYMNVNGVPPEFHWLGATDVQPEGAWYWVDTKVVPMGGPYWQRGQPNGFTYQNCLAMADDSYRNYVDEDCENEYMFVCYYNIFS